MAKNAHANAITRLLLHLHPPKVDAQAIKFTRTFGLGGIAALLFVMLFVSGMLLRFAYVPSEKGAYDSILALQNDVLLGSLVRNLHYWSGMLLVVVAFLHVLRVFYTNSIYHHRRKNWLYGLILMFVVVFSNFTGYLLPWDQLAFWAVTIMTNMLSYIPFVGDSLATLVRGGQEVSEVTLLRFYHFHTGLLPLLMVFLMSVHFWLVRKSKGVTVQHPDKTEMVDVQPHLLSKEMMVAMITIVTLLLMAMFFDAPLLEKANPHVSPNPSKAPWYFMGFQELLLHIHPGFGSFVIPLLVTAFFIYIPFTRYSQLNVGRWFNSDTGRKLTIWSVVFAVVLTLLVIITSEFLLDLRALMPGVPLLITNGVLLLLLYALPAGGFLWWMKKRLSAAKIEVVMAAFTIIVTAYIVMAIVGSLMRGEGMHLFA